MQNKYSNFKKLFILYILYIIALACPRPLFAQESTPSATPIKSSTLEKINILKEKVASKVAELNKVIEFAADGTITKLEEGLFEFSANGQQKTVNTDNNSKILMRNSQLKVVKIEFADLSKDEQVTVIGKEQFGTGIVNATLIVKSPKFVFFAGKLKKINKNKFTFTVVESEGTKEENEYVFDYEKYTQAFAYNKEKDKLEDAGFSRLKENARIQILALPQKTSETRFTALRLILIP